ncbi:hypothetical protein PF003_g32038 [Phytophthora fragariae]|nr:hypothetical protein PF003_g32038 [Phytophthora fragariae]
MMVTLSSAESEYIAMAAAVQECIGLMMVLKDIGMPVGPIVVMEGNQGAQQLAESKGVTQRSRHIDTKYHWLRDKIASGDVCVQYCPTSKMVADHFTKPLGRTKFERFRSALVFVEWGCWEWATSHSSKTQDDDFNSGSWYDTNKLQ